MLCLLCCSSAHLDLLALTLIAVRALAEMESGLSAELEAGDVLPELESTDDEEELGVSVRPLYGLNVLPADSHVRVWRDEAVQALQQPKSGESLQCVALSHLV